MNRVLGREEKLRPWMLGKGFFIYNGKQYKKLEVVRLRIGLKSGDFIITRKFPVHKKKVRFYNK
jgi:ribosomal protein S19